MSHDQSGPVNEERFENRLTRVVIVITATILLVSLIVLAARVIVLFFIGILLALLLRGLARPLSKRSRLSPRVATITVMLLILALFGVGGYVLGPRLSNELSEITEQLPQSINAIEQDIEGTPWGSRLLEMLPSEQSLGNGQLLTGQLFSQITGVFSSALSVLLDIVVVLFVGLYLALEPSLYSDNLVRLFPSNRRERTREVLLELGETLMNWLIARLFSVLVVIVLTYIGLVAIGMPLELTLAIIAGVLSFIPNLGPLLGLLPALLIAFSRGPTMVLYVFVLYNLIQFVESYFITPWVQRYTLSLPPALTITLQLLAAILLGLPAVFVAAPALAAIIVLVKELYVQDILGDPTEKIIRSSD